MYFDDGNLIIVNQKHLRNDRIAMCENGYDLTEMIDELEERALLEQIELVTPFEGYDEFLDTDVVDEMLFDMTDTIASEEDVYDAEMERRANELMAEVDRDLLKKMEAEDDIFGDIEVEDEEQIQPVRSSMQLKDVLGSLTATKAINMGVLVDTLSTEVENGNMTPNKAKNVVKMQLFKRYNNPYRSTTDVYEDEDQVRDFLAV